MKTEKTRVTGERRRNLFKTSHKLGGRWKVVSRETSGEGAYAPRLTNTGYNIDIWSNGRRHETRCWDTEETKGPK